MARILRLMTAAGLVVCLATACTSSEEALNNEAPPPLTGTFETLTGPFESGDGQPLALDPVEDTWSFRTTCNDDRCVAMAVAVPSRGNPLPNPPTRILDYVDDVWIWTGTVDSTCRPVGRTEVVPTQAWKRWTLTGQTDGPPTGTLEAWYLADGCNKVSSAPITFTEVEAASTEVPDPATQGAPVGFAAPAAWHGQYSETLTPTSSGAPDVGRTTDDVKTMCLPSGESCVTLVTRVSDSVSPSKPDKAASINNPRLAILRFAAGQWTSESVGRAKCDRGPSTMTTTETFPLLTGAPNPIVSIGGERRDQIKGSCSGTNTYRVEFQRTGD